MNCSAALSRDSCSNSATLLFTLPAALLEGVPGAEVLGVLGTARERGVAGDCLDLGVDGTGVEGAILGVLAVVGSGSPSGSSTVW